MEQKSKLTQEEARQVLAEYPDADLSAFEIEGDPDVNALAVEAVVARIKQMSPGDIRGAFARWLPVTLPEQTPFTSPTPAAPDPEDEDTEENSA